MRSERGRGGLTSRYLISAARADMACVRSTWAGCGEGRGGEGHWRRTGTEEHKHSRSVAAVPPSILTSLFKSWTMSFGENSADGGEGRLSNGPWLEEALTFLPFSDQNVAALQHVCQTSCLRVCVVGHHQALSWGQLYQQGLWREGCGLPEPDHGEPADLKIGELIAVHKLRHSQLPCTRISIGHAH